MNTLDKQKFNQYRKVKFYIAVCFWIFSLSMFAGGSRKAVSENKSGEKKISGNRVEDEAIKIDIIINKDSNTDFENENENLEKTDDEDGDLIYLDRIQDEEEEKQQKKLKKTNRIERFIKKIDDKEIYIENESAGIKKIISILSALVYYIKEENALVVIDELDVHIFEYLLAIILKNISEIAKGQLIFTAHNLSPLERLEKENIVITSIEKEKVNYSYLKNVSKTTNLRQKYIRSQAIWSEDNIIPLNLNESALKMYLKKLVK